VQLRESGFAGSDVSRGRDLQEALNQLFGPEFDQAARIARVVVHFLNRNPVMG